MDIDGALARFAQARREHIREHQGSNPDALDLVDLALLHASGGKHLRAGFTHAGWCVGGGDPDDPRITQAAAAFEWLQASALVHDDVMDDSGTRRGRPTIHRTHSVNAAILAGDLLLAWADQMLHESAPDGSDWHLAEALRVWDLCKSEVITGQYLDVTAESRAELSVDAALAVVTLKAAKYTIERPLHVGAALAGADTALLEALSAYAIPLGQAFQLRDDLLGVFGDPAITGKPAGDDLREGKRTVLVARGAELLGADRVLALLGREDSVAELALLLEQSGAREAVEQDIVTLETASHAALAYFEPEAQSRLEMLATAATQRAR